MKIAIASDHAGYEYKEKLKTFLKEIGFNSEDMGTYSSESVDYPDYAITLSKKVSSGEFAQGILICGTGIGMSITANKITGVRAAVCESVESAKYSRLHNNANVLCLGARITPIEKAKEIVKVFLETEFEGGRHASRIEKIHRLTGI
ncbi:MAG: ribose 5-phosphate isomerase B [Bacteroidota bacterium]|nr:ribose 5-phosphate isomerase B [Bacteroidota bacterium]